MVVPDTREAKTPLRSFWLRSGYRILYLFAEHSGRESVHLPLHAKEAAKKTMSKAKSAIVEGSEEALEEFLPQARKIDARDIVPFRADAALAYHNIVIGVGAVLAKEEALAKLPKPFDLKLLKSLPRLALAVVFAARQVDRNVASPGTIAKLLTRAAELRKLLLTAADALVNSGIIPAGLVKKIRAGKGKRDLAQDCVDLAALFRKYAAAIAGKTAITPQDIDEAATVGDSLVKVLVPKAARKAKKAPDALINAVDVRDRLWTLVVTRYREHLRRAGMWLWVDDVDEHVPLLQSRAAATSKPKQTGQQPPAQGPG